MESPDWLGDDAALYDVQSRADGPEGRLPLSEDQLSEWPSGHLFGMSQDAGMGWPAATIGGDAYLVLSTQGGLRRDDGRPLALGYHTGHWEVGLLVAEAAATFREAAAIPYAAACTDPCDGRSQGTAAMFDSLPYRNDAAIVMRRLIRSLPRRKGVLGVGTCDKGLPALLMAVAGTADTPAVVVPGGVTLPARRGEDAGTVQSIGTRFVRGTLSLERAAELGCRACASPGGGCQFLGTAATSQVVAEALGLALPHTALAPSGQPIWLEAAARSARALTRLARDGVSTRDVLTQGSLNNAMVVFAAFGGSSNLLIHLPAIAHAAGLERPTLEQWAALSRETPRLVEAMPNGPHPTVSVFLAGGVPEVMLRLRDRLDLDVVTTTGESLGTVLGSWERSDRRHRLRGRLKEEGIDPEEVIRTPSAVRARGTTPTFSFPRGNLAPGGSVIKCSAVDPELVRDGRIEISGAARVFEREVDAMAAIKAGRVAPADVLILRGRGPRGAGMEEIYQVTAALRVVPELSRVAVVTDARFSGATRGPCVGHVTPEALAGGPLGRVRDGDLVRVLIDVQRGGGSVDMVGEEGRAVGPEEGGRILRGRRPADDLQPDDDLPEDTALWARLQELGGGVWGGCVYDAQALSGALGEGTS